MDRLEEERRVNKQRRKEGDDKEEKKESKREGGEDKEMSNEAVIDKSIWKAGGAGTDSSAKRNRNRGKVEGDRRIAEKALMLCCTSCYKESFIALHFSIFQRNDRFSFSQGKLSRRR